MNLYISPSIRLCKAVKLPEALLKLNYIPCTCIVYITCTCIFTPMYFPLPAGPIHPANSPGPVRPAADVRTGKEHLVIIYMYFYAFKRANSGSSIIPPPPPAGPAAAAAADAVPGPGPAATAGPGSAGKGHLIQCQDRYYIQTMLANSKLSSRTPWP